MSRYIDADALIAELQKDANAFDDEAEDARKNSRNYTDGDLYSVMGRAEGIRDAMMEVYDASTVDAVSVVRCKECKYWEESQYYQEFMVCTYVKGATFTRQHDDFCSRGERKEGE